jgi:acylphosphatase
MWQQKIIVTGKVQGVYFKVSTAEKAQALGLTGWVRNLTSGQVEILACGKRGKVQDLIDWCHQGPSEARVDLVQTTDCSVTEPDDFRILSQ